MLCIACVYPREYSTDGMEADMEDFIFPFPRDRVNPSRRNYAEALHIACPWDDSLGHRSRIA